MQIRAYRNTSTKLEPVAISFKPIKPNSDLLVRIHDACFTSETLGSLKCDCKEQLHLALDRIAKEGGLVIYLPQEGRGIGLANKIAAYAKQDEGFDTVEANRQIHMPIESRSYEDAAMILKDLEISQIHLMTNNPLKIDALRATGIEILTRVPIVAKENQHSASYLETKKFRMGHLF